MAAEHQIRRCLDLLTIADLADLHSPERENVADLRGILESENYLGAGIAEKRSGGAPTGILALTFYVREKVDKKWLTAREAVPPALPAALSGPQRLIPTDVVVLGGLELQRRKGSGAARPFTPAPGPFLDPHWVQPGNGMGLDHQADHLGTFGAVVSAGTERMALSARHVVADAQAIIGNPISYEAMGQPAAVVGNLQQVSDLQTDGSLVNRSDAAVVKLHPDALARLRAQIRNLDRLPSGIVQPQRGMKVIKVGFTSDLTEGEILDVDFRYQLDYPGDSGSLVLEKDSFKAVGLHLAATSEGAPGGGSVFSPISAALAALGVNLETQ
jgi:hypothetical protein